MTHKEKAKELIERMLVKIKGNGVWVTSPLETLSEDERDWKLHGKKAKECAIVAVDEILNNDSVGVSCDDNFLICDAEYWEGVKLEIQNYQP